MSEIERIMQKLETASNLQKSGALTGPEWAQLQAYVRAAEALRVDVAVYTRQLLNAATAAGHTYRDAPIPFG
jgi:hypothetical protein